MSDQLPELSLESAGTHSWPGGRLYLVAGFQGSSIQVPTLTTEGGPTAPVDTPNFTFALPEYSTAFAKLFNQVADELTREKSSVLRNVRSTTAQRIGATHVTTESGEVVSNPPIAIALPYSVVTRDVVNCELRAFASWCDEAAEILTDKKVDALIDYSSRISEACGRVGAADGRPFGWPVLMQALELVQIEFSPDGEPLLPMIVAENDKRNCVPYPPMTDSERSAFDELMARKRRESHA